MHRRPLPPLAAFQALARHFRPGAPMAVTPSEGAVVEAGSTSSLAEFIGEFARLVAGMEERFLPLGADLGTIVQHLQSLVRAAGDGFGTIRQEMANGSLGELDVRADAALQALKHQLGSAAQRMQPLSEVSDDLYRLQSLGDEVRRIGAFLLACGSSFAVESARREDSRAAFFSFVGELRGLARQIGNLAERMQEDSHLTISQLSAARRRIHENVTELDRLAHTMQGAFATASGEIKQLLDGMHQVLDRVERHRLAITEKTSGVIYYLQFGDIVRQKCEHVLAAAREAGDATAAPETLPVIVHTAAAQLEVIQQEVQEARTRLADAYAGLDRELGHMAECGRALNASGRKDSGDSWERLRLRLQELERIQRQEARLNADAVKTASEAGTAAAALHAGLGSVREMSTHLHLLALNAIIQTAHLGVHGRTLEELAQHVDGLHRNCEKVVPEVVRILEAIAERVATFTGQRDENSAFDLGGLQQLERAQQGSVTVMQEVLGLASDGEDLIRSALSRLTTLDALSREIATHRQALLQIAERLPAPAPGRATASAAAFDARMLERYTMQSERDAHQRARGLAVERKPVEDIELFSLPDDRAPARPSPDATTPALAAPASKAADDLGDNIELF